jgi:hypothetical protein
MLRYGRVMAVLVVGLLWLGDAPTARAEQAIALGRNAAAFTAATSFLTASSLQLVTAMGPSSPSIAQAPEPAPPPDAQPAPLPDAPSSPPAPVAPPAPPAATPEKPPPPAVRVLDKAETQGVLGREVRSKTGENMGRVVEVIVDRSTGQTRAAIIDFGGFLGVGSRKIAVAWSALQFASDQSSERITLDLTRDQVKGAPEYKEGRPIMALTRSGESETLPYER